MKKNIEPEKGEIDYDKENDILSFKVRGREYNHSVELNDFVLDITSEGDVAGIQIFEASSVLGVSTYILESIRSWEFKVTIGQGMITIRISFVGKAEEKGRPLEKFTQQLTTAINGHHLTDSFVQCAAA